MPESDHSREAMIRLEAVTKRYPGHPRPAVDAMTFDVRDDEVAVLVGPSGCGKTTTMKMINRLIEPTAGRIVVDGTDVSKVKSIELRRRIGYVIEQIGLFPNMTIAQNVAIVPQMLGGTSAASPSGWTSCWSSWASIPPSTATGCQRGRL